MFDLSGMPWTSIAFFPVLGVLAVVAAVAVVVAVRAGRRGRTDTRDRAVLVAGVFVALAAVWPVVAVVLTPIGAD